MSRGMSRRKQRPTHAPMPIAPSWEQLVDEAMRPGGFEWVPWGYELTPPAPAPQPEPVKPEASLLGLLDDSTQLMPVIDYVLEHPWVPGQVAAVAA